MQITRQSEYAIKILIELAKAEIGQLISSRIISEHQDIPEVFLQKTVQQLARAGLVTTQRGIQGGVRLAVAADEITIANVLQAIEGPVAINPCLGTGFVCPNSVTCQVRRILNRAQEAMNQELNRETIADIVAGNIQV
ncbi:MAG: RrF2 family transcriptional regulator [Methylocystaceae bacterium]